MTEPQNTTDDRIPTPAAHVDLEIVEGEALLYHPQQTRAVYLNPTAAAIWGLCDGKRSVADIVRVISESYPEAEGVAEDVRTTVEQLQQNGVVVVR